MPTHPKLSRAPIAEALLDVRIVGRPGFQAESFHHLRDQLGEYPVVDRQRSLRAEFEVKDGQPLPPTQTDMGLRGVLFRSADRLNVAQFRVDGFTFNRLSPYTSWDSIFPEAMRLWMLYVTLSKPELVTRVAVRYINRIMLPSPVADLSEYLESPPSVPPALPVVLTRFMTAVVFEDPDRGAAANVAIALESPTAVGAPLILDIDAYKTEELDPGSDAIRGRFEILRSFKNDIFFKSLKKKLVEMFQ